MLEPLAHRSPPREDARVRLAEVLAALVEQAQKKNPSLTVEDIAEKAHVHRVTLAKILGAAKAGRARTVDEETFWDVCAVLGQDSETALAPGLRAVVEAWRRERGLPATEARRAAKKRGGGS